MKNCIYFFFLLLACSSPNADIEDKDVSEGVDNEVFELDEVSAEIEVREDLVEFPDYPLNYSGPDHCLPKPTQEFLERRAAGTLPSFIDSGSFYLNDFYLYLEMALDTVSAKQFVTAHYAQTSLYWGQEFENGIYYSYRELESGGEFEVWTRCKDKAAFFSAIEPVITKQELEDNEGYSWNELHTEYGPVDGEPGCYYTVSKDSLGYFHLSSYCGC